MINLDNNLEDLKQKINQLDLSLNESELDLLRNELDKLTPFVFGGEKLVPKIERLTINRLLPDNNNETVKEIKLLKNPPAEYVKKHGRANLVGQSVFYGTFILPTALLELKPQNGDIVTISKWKLKNETDPLMIYPVIDYYNCKDLQLRNEFHRYIQKYPKELQEIIITDNLLLAFYFGREVDRNKHHNYIYSAHYADKILNSYFDGKIDAIIYPSVQDSTNSPNIAIKPDVFNEKYEIEEINEFLVVTDGKRSIFLESRKKTNNVDKLGIIKW